MRLGGHQGAGKVPALPALIALTPEGLEGLEGLEAGGATWLAFALRCNSVQLCWRHLTGLERLQPCQPLIALTPNAKGANLQPLLAQAHCHTDEAKRWLETRTY